MNYIRPCLCVLLILAVGCRPPAKPVSKESEEPAVVPVTVAPVVARSVQHAVEVMGTLWAFEEVPLIPKTEGRVQTVAVDVGDRVRPGQLLGTFDTTDFELAVKQAERSLQVELAKLGLDALPSRGFDLDSVPLVKNAFAKLENARSQLARTKSLVERKAAPSEELTDKQANERMLDADYHNQLLVAKSGLAMVEMKQAELEVARQHLRDCRVLTPLPSRPIPGVPIEETTYAVTARSVAEGTYVKANVEVGRLMLDQALRLRTPVPERHAPEIQVGQAVELTAAAHPGVVVGKVARINPGVDPTTRTFEVEIVVPNRELTLKPGGFAKAKILTRTDSAAPTVPLESVVRFAGVTKLFVMEGGKVKAVPVELGEQDRSWIEIRRPAIKPGAQVVTSGQSVLADGVAVRVREEGAVKIVVKEQTEAAR